MWFFAQLALRNVARNLRRTLLSMGSIVAGVGVIVLGRSFIGGLEENIIRTQIDSLSAHVQVRPADYPTVGISHPVDALVDVTPELQAAIAAEGGITAPRLLFAPRAVFKGDSVRVRAIGFDPAKDGTVFPRDTWYCKEKWSNETAPPTEEAVVDPFPSVKACVGLEPKTAADGVLVAANVARLLGLSPGDSLILETRTHAGSINALSVPIRAVFTTGNNLLDRFGVFVPMDLATDLVRNDGKPSHLSILLPNRADAFAAAERLGSQVPASLSVVTWHHDALDMLEVQKIRRAALNALVFMLMVISALGIMNTILMAAYERVREVGTLRAMGMNRSGVVALFLAEGAVLGLVGGTVGAGIGGYYAYSWSTDGIDLSAGLAGAGNVAMSSMLYTEFSPPAVGLSIVFATAVAIAGSIWPAFVASSMQPADAVRAG